MATRSDPPPSYPPPPPVPPQSQRVSAPDLYTGWRPADDDISLQAADWRARTSLRRADRALVAIEKLSASVDALSATMQAWSSRWDKHWATLGRLAWFVGVPLIVAFLSGAAAIVWRWVSTLHH